MPLQVGDSCYSNQADAGAAACGLFEPKTTFVNDASSDAVIDITWSPNLRTPHLTCSVNGAMVESIQYGFPTVFNCRSLTTGELTYKGLQDTPSCPTGYAVDFQALRCVPLGSSSSGTHIRTVSCESADPASGLLNLKVTTTPVNGQAAPVATMTQQAMSYPPCTQEDKGVAFSLVLGAVLSAWGVCYGFWKLYQMFNQNPRLVD